MKTCKTCIDNGPHPGRDACDACVRMSNWEPNYSQKLSDAFDDWVLECALKHQPPNLIVILNGPPGCGKDTIAEALGFPVLTFKEEIFRDAIHLSRMSSPEFMERYNNRDLKEVPWDKLGGMSCRDFMIFVSEHVTKRIHGQDFYGRAVARLVKPGVDYVISDGGFLPEIEALRDATKTTHKVVIIRIHRKGCTFKGDSRNYVGKGHLVANIEGKLSAAVTFIERIIKDERSI